MGRKLQRGGLGTEGNGKRIEKKMQLGSCPLDTSHFLCGNEGLGAQMLASQQQRQRWFLS